MKIYKIADACPGVYIKLRDKLFDLIEENSSITPDWDYIFDHVVSIDLLSEWARAAGNDYVYDDPNELIEKCKQWYPKEKEKRRQEQIRLENRHYREQKDWEVAQFVDKQRLREERDAFIKEKMKNGMSLIDAMKELFPGQEDYIDSLQEKYPKIKEKSVGQTA
jgi:hypothetical protein